MKHRFHTLYYSYTIFFALLAFANYNRFFLFLFYIAASFALHPDIIKRTGMNLAVREGRRIFSIAGLAIFLASVPIIVHYKSAEDRGQLEENLQQVRNIETERIKRDSFSHYLNQANLAEEKKPDSAIQYLNAGASFSQTAAEKNLVHTSINRIENNKIERLIRKKNYKRAISLLDSLIALDDSDDRFYLHRGICYQKSQKAQKAIPDFKKSADLGNQQAADLFEKMNPIRKYVVGYITLCCDGTTSGARGRGACSHHGGVCNWNQPVYEERRQYE